MFPKWAKLVLIISYAIYCPLDAWALPQDQKESLVLIADNVKLNNEKRQGHFVGHVKIEQGSSTIYADQVFTYLDEQHQLNKAIATGSQSHPAKFTTRLEGEAKLLVAKADRLTYLPLKQQIVLNGQASIQQGSQTYKAPVIIYDIQHKRILSHKVGNKRSSIVIAENIL